MVDIRVRVSDDECEWIYYLDPVDVSSRDDVDKWFRTIGLACYRRMKGDIDG